ncbi:PSD1 and planctomycete cytochrome C domain-containing protein [uncultured Gimesia sp.]|uniref:PSD1 and planctomycete cytochrome C domain-containing protein n=1 Tax=uncultured Gimesia sp. TaxID=1678688 RepID=UPI00260F565A|nr:PSD1 and planctomycete cytochrome C domain-containing protein [uncultured Gimesia sp.]
MYGSQKARTVLGSLSVVLVMYLFAPTVSLSAPLPAAKPVTPQQIDFKKSVQPIFVKHCQDCHGPDAREGGLRLTNRKNILLRNDSGEPAIIAGKSDLSLLIHRVSTQDKKEQMPPSDAGERLSRQEIGILKQWIDQGAPWPTESEAPKHWAYLPPVKSSIPAVKGSYRIHNPIDAFIVEKLNQQKTPLTQSPQASPARLLRRVSLDLIGLPPTPEAVLAFEKDPSPEAYEKYVDALLKSPRYGEKWARQWLDLARYADSNGFQADQLREMWLYRDWVINSINQDLPFDQFTIQQIAGDLLPQATLDQKIATGFHRCTTCNVEAGVDPEENRVNQIFDRVNTTGLVWLGTTFECAQCHNHKYDPFSQQDYYQIFAFFNNTPLEVKQVGKSVTFEVTGPKLALPLNTNEIKTKDELTNQRLAVQNQLKAREKELANSVSEWEDTTLALLENSEESAKVPVAIQKILRIEAEKRTAKQTKSLTQFQQQQDQTYAELEKDLNRIKNELEAFEPDSTLVMVEMPEPRMNNIFKRGDFLSKGAEVTPNTPDALHSMKTKETPSRLEFAKWLVAKENPLVARVTVNRWWSQFFGQGIVATQEDFGSQGDAPTHPELLDWLAVDFMEHNWSMKQIHKTIVMSATYQQSAKVTPALLEVDPYNKLYTRGPRLRLSAETIRDNALAISGLLSTKMGGPPIYPPQPEGLWRHVGRNAPKYLTSTAEDRYRRGVYVIWRRSAPYPSFTNFDAPDRGACVINRSRTNTPLQALTLLNDPAYVEIGIGLAKRLATKGLATDLSDRERIAYAFRLCVAREPKDVEVEHLTKVFQQELNYFQEHPQAAQKLISADNRPEGVGASRMAAWLYVANILLNLDETITKG